MLIFGICDILIRIIKIYDKQREKQLFYMKLIQLIRYMTQIYKIMKMENRFRVN